MYGLNATLNIASQAISAESGAIATTNNNISNVNTAGYSREIVDLSPAALTNGSGVQGDGVSYDGYTSVRNEVLQIGIQQKTAASASLSTQSTLWNQLQTGFSSTTSGLGAALSGLFSALSASSTEPSDDGVRQAVLTAAGNVADSFQQAASALSDAQSQADSNVSGIVAEINGLTTQIASLDQQLASTPGEDGGSVEDQRDALTVQLAGLVGVASTSTQNTPSLSTANGSPLVVNGTAYALQVTRAPDGTARVLDAQGKDITATLIGGSLGGTLLMRDTSIPAAGAGLNTLASQFATAMNAAQAQGYDANGNQGTAMFSLPTNGTSQAAGITLALSNVSAVALSSDGSDGSSGNLSNLLAVQSTPLPSGQTPTNMYASFVQGIGDAAASVTTNQTATSAALSQLTNQQASESGVSIDEETVNLERFQQAYTAAARVVSTVSSLYSVLMNMGA